MDPSNSSLDLMPAHGLITSGTFQSEKGMSALSIETNIRVFKVIGQAKPVPHGPQLHKGSLSIGLLSSLLSLESVIEAADNTQ